MKLEDNGIGDVIEDEDQRGWSFFNGVIISLECIGEWECILLSDLTYNNHKKMKNEKKPHIYLVKKNVDAIIPSLTVMKSKRSYKHRIYRCLSFFLYFKVCGMENVLIKFF